MKNILITNKIIPDFFNLFDKEKYNLIIGENLNRQQLIEHASLSDAIISMLSDRIDQELIDNSPKLKIIAQYAVGYNNINIEACKKRAIIVTNTPDVLSHATAEHALALTLACARNILPANTNVLQNKWLGWEPMGFLGRSLKGLNLGIIGPGKIGYEYAKMCKNAFDMQVSYYSRSRNEKFENELNATSCELEKLLTQSDIISIHCPLNECTHNLLDLKKLSLMKADAILINTARGEIINQDDLITLLEKGKFHAVGLDVTTPEPLPEQSGLRSFQRVLITPHIASATFSARRDMARIVCENVLCVLENQSPKNIINL